MLPQNKTSEQVAISMDWLPTLLAAAGRRPDPRVPPDGINLLPMPHGAAPSSRARCSGATRRTRSGRSRDGDFKYLKILDNTFLFNVVDDPMERANLKARRPDVYERLAKDWLGLERDDAAGNTRVDHGRQQRGDVAGSHRSAQHHGAGYSFSGRIVPVRRAQ